MILWNVATAARRCKPGTTAGRRRLLAKCGHRSPAVPCDLPARTPSGPAACRNGPSTTCRTFVPGNGWRLPRFAPRRDTQRVECSANCDNNSPRRPEPVAVGVARGRSTGYPQRGLAATRQGRSGIWLAAAGRPRTKRARGAQDLARIAPLRLPKANHFGMLLARNDGSRHGPPRPDGSRRRSSWIPRDQIVRPLGNEAASRAAGDCPGGNTAHDEHLPIH